MKKLLFLIALLSQFLVASAQTDWGSWGPLSCYKGFQGSIRKLGYVKTINQYSYQGRIKNSYGRKVTFNMNWLVVGEKLSIGQVTLNPNEVYEHTSRYFKNDAEIMFIEVENVNFSDKLNCYAACDNGTPNQPNCDNQNVSSTSFQEVNSIPPAKQNGLNDYNRSKQQLEDEMNRKNAEIQRQNLENTNRKQQFINVYNEGVALGNTGKYAEAAAKYQQAIGSATTENERQQAQNAYNKISKINNQTQVLTQASSVLLGAASALDAAIARNKEKKQNQIELNKSDKKIKLSNLTYSNLWYYDLLNHFSKYGSINSIRTNEERRILDSVYLDVIAKHGLASFLSNRIYYTDFSVNSFLSEFPFDAPLSQDVLIRCDNSDIYQKFVDEKWFQKYVTGTAKVKLDKTAYTILIDNTSYTPSLINSPSESNNAVALAQVVDNSEIINVLTKLKESLNASDRNIDVITQNILEYFRHKNMPVLRKKTEPSKGGGDMTVYYLEDDEKVFIAKYDKQNELNVWFLDEYQKIGKNFYADTKCSISSASGGPTKDFPFIVTFALTNK